MQKQDDLYMDPQVVCSGLSTLDTRPAAACKPCTSQGCAIGEYIAGRCMRNVNASLSPSADTTFCVRCSPCARGEYMATPCDGGSFRDSKICTPCKYGANGTRAAQLCPAGSFLVDECTSGRDPFDPTQCSNCSSNCRSANYSKGDNGQYIAKICSAGEPANTCGNCDGPCAAFESALNPGQYIAEFCYGQTTQNRQCVGCRTSCASR